MNKWHWKKQSSGEPWALITASDEMVLYSWCDDCGEHGIVGTDEALALIGAAPDLLEALRAMRKNYYDIDSRCLALADAAIAKSEGKPMKFRWRPILAVTLACISGVGILGLWIVLDLPWYAQIPVSAVLLGLLYVLAED